MSFEGGFLGGRFVDLLTMVRTGRGFRCGLTIFRYVSMRADVRPSDRSNLRSKKLETVEKTECSFGRGCVFLQIPPPFSPPNPAPFFFQIHCRVPPPPSPVFFAMPPSPLSLSRRSCHQAVSGTFGEEGKEEGEEAGKGGEGVEEEGGVSER